ncbi:MAG: toll/interleukin-1 receptor domain-containing protein, partial [Anaerolineae bacterium]|nr:toll/interleukin-1 receptor domain-containing protein [Anaerolineae bacterium]
MSDVFISYAKTDNQNSEITLLVTALNSLTSPIQKDINVTTWFDENGIRKGEDWSSEIDIGIEEAHTVAVFISPAYFASKICNREFKTALQLGKKLIPVWISAVSAGTIEAEIEKRKNEGKEVSTLAEAMQNYTAIRDKQAIRLDIDPDPLRSRTLRELVTAIFENAKLDDGATEWLGRALAKERGTGSWLSGNDLRQAETWLIEVNNTPNYIAHEKTKLFILYSRRATVRRT